jgi:uncharacterized membrane protein
MQVTLILTLQSVWHALNYSLDFMLWNLFLAFIPLGLSFWLFRSATLPSVGWWLGFFLFMLFLPNAPYVLTDVIHLIQLIRADLPLWMVTLALVPQYMLFLLLGFEAYVISLLNFRHYFFRKQKLQRYYLAIEWLIHFLCGIGIYLGRFPRFNSWDLFTHPDFLFRSLARVLLDPTTLLLIGLIALIIGILSQLLKHFNLALKTSYFPRSQR